MPRLHVLAVAPNLPAWAETACTDYVRRMPRGYEVARVEVKRDDRLQAALPRGARVVALDERGKDFSTVQFAGLLQQSTAFLIGGADGLEAKVKEDAALLLRVSAFTLPHALAQVILLEQIYRAASFLGGHPYHRQ